MGFSPRIAGATAAALLAAATVWAFTELPGLWVWAAFIGMMQSGPSPVHAAEALRRALLRGRSGTVRTGRFFQAVLGPFLARFGSLALRRRVQEKYFGL